MLAISRALATDPKVLLLDELSMGLAPLIVADLYERSAALAARGMTVLLVEQFVTTALGGGRPGGHHGARADRGPGNSPTRWPHAAQGAYLDGATPRLRPARPRRRRTLNSAAQVFGRQFHFDPSSGPSASTSSSTVPASRRSPTGEAQGVQPGRGVGDREPDHRRPHRALGGGLLPADRTQDVDRGVEDRGGLRRRLVAQGRQQLARRRPRGAVHRSLLPPAPHLFGHEGEERGEEAHLHREGQGQGRPGRSRCRARPASP